MATPIFEVLADANRTRLESKYQYLGPHNGLYAFVNPDTGTAELFARRTDAYAGWHLVRGSYFYEFVSSMPNLNAKPKAKHCWKCGEHTPPGSGYLDASWRVPGWVICLTCSQERG